MLEALEKEKVACKLTTIKGAGHSFTPKQNQGIVQPALVAWFEKHVAAKKGEWLVSRDAKSSERVWRYRATRSAPNTPRRG
jgi:hypothetical protein